MVFIHGSADAENPGSFAGGALTLFGLLDRDRRIGFPVGAEPGLLVAFRSTIVHSVTPVTDGERYTVVSWFY